MKQHAAGFANFICKFGDKDLIDYAETIVIPAFKDEKLVRSYGSTHFILYDVRFVTLDSNTTPATVALTGRFVKDTELSREQLLDRNRGLIKAPQKMRSAPSMFFILILNNHRLIFFPETKHAPSLDMFRATVHWRLKRKHREYVDLLHQQYKDRGERVTKKTLYQIHPAPSLDIIPVSGDEQIRSFIRRYHILKRIDFRLIPTNDEIDAEVLFDSVRQYLGSDLDAKTTKIAVSNPKGLDTDAAIVRVEAATTTANQEVTLSGVDIEGNELRGDNHHFRVSTPIEEAPKSQHELTSTLYDAFRHLVNKGVIRIGNQSRNISNQIQRLRNLF